MSVVRRLGVAAVLAAAVALPGCLGVPGARPGDEGEVDAGADGSGGDCVPATAYAPFADDFEDGAPPSWGSYDDGAATTVEEAGGRATIAPSGALEDWGRIASAPFDLAAGRIAAEIREVPDWPGELWFGAAAAGATGEPLEFAGVWISGGELWTVVDDEWLTETPYQPTFHRWAQVRVAGAELTIETSPDARAWTPWWSGAAPPWIGDAELVVLGGSDEPEGVDAELGLVGIDNLNLTAERCP